MDPQATRFLPESLCSAATKATISQTPNMEPKESKELRTEQKKISPCAAELLCSVMMLGLVFKVLTALAWLTGDCRTDIMHILCTLALLITITPPPRHRFIVLTDGDRLTRIQVMSRLLVYCVLSGLWWLKTPASSQSRRNVAHHKQQQPCEPTHRII